MRRCIIIFGREPIPGRVKTRLARDIGPEAAARIYSRLLLHTIEEARYIGIPVLLSLAEEIQGSWSPPEGLEIEVQADGNLGRRMREAFRSRFEEGADQVLLVGSDCPGLNRSHLLKAFEQLHRFPVVLGPASDGGYWAIGQRGPGVDCFTGVPWSSQETLKATRASLRSQQLDWSELEILGDIDTIGDLDLLEGLDDLMAISRPSE